jgi:EAL domain-containing protein (putative c-di-GMP-specific phosphodiesterase class I)
MTKESINSRLYTILITNLILILSVNYFYFNYIKEQKQIKIKNDIESEITIFNKKVELNFQKNEIKKIIKNIKELEEKKDISEILFSYKKDGDLATINSDKKFQKNLYEKVKTYNKNNDRYLINIKYLKEIEIKDLEQELILQLLISLIYIFIIIFYTISVLKQINVIYLLGNKINNFDIETQDKIYIKIKEENYFYKTFAMFNILINELKIIKKELKDKNIYITNLQENLDVWFIEIDENKKIISSIGKNHVIPKNYIKEFQKLEDLIFLIDDKKEKIKTTNKIKQSIKSEESIEIEIKININMVYKYLLLKGEYNYNKKIYSFIIEEKTIEKTMKEKLNKIVKYDSITELEKIDNFIENHNKILKEKNKYSIININISNIEKIINLYNKDITNEMIREINRLLQNKADYIYKNNYNTFTIIVKYIEINNIEYLINDIKKILMKKIIINENQIYLDIKLVNYNLTYNKSIDIRYIIEELNKSIETLKFNGNENFIKQQYNKTMIEQNIENNKIYIELRKDIENNNNLELKFQPKYNLKEDKYNSVEVLLRWQNQKKSMIEIIEIVKNNNGLNIFTNYILKESIKILEKWKNDNFTKTKLSINIEIQQLNSIFLSNIKKLILIHNINPEMLIFELNGNKITEENKSIINILKKIGINFMFDNFNKESNFSLLLIPELVKDIKLSKDIIEDKKILEELIKNYKYLNFNINNIEEEKDIEEYKNIGINEIQGYYYSKLLNLKEIELFLKENNK